jgi:hypothetical protein
MYRIRNRMLVNENSLTFFKYKYKKVVFLLSQFSFITGPSHQITFAFNFLTIILNFLMALFLRKLHKTLSNALFFFRRWLAFALVVF